MKLATRKHKLVPQIKNNGKMVSFNRLVGELSNDHHCTGIWSPLGLSLSVQRLYLFTY